MGLMDARGCGLVASAVVLVSTLCVGVKPASAQIWVLTEPDGTERFTSEPEPGARLYLRTMFSRRDRATNPQVPFADSIDAAAAETGIEPELLQAVIAAESNYDPRATSPKGARGLMQLMPETATELGVRDVWNPRENIRGGSVHLARLLKKFDDVSLALAAYNAGEGAVERHGGIPPFEETQQYVRKVLSYYRSYQDPE